MKITLCFAALCIFYTFVFVRCIRTMREQKKVLLEQQDVIKTQADVIAHALQVMIKTSGVLFREHRGCLDESMKTLVMVKDFDGLVAHLHTLLDPYNFKFTSEDVNVQPYGADDRIGWDTQIVTLEGYGPVGFLSKPFEMVQ